ncbi:MAG: Eco57I restriction-modification methylase domain-containing protein [Aquaticitalea sp.]
MALFQKSVIKTYLKLQDTDSVQKAYKKYTKYFHNTVIQENIKGSKEEQFQAKFLDELFVNILGYTMNPKPDYNLTTEFKNQKNNRKADGALLANGKAVGVIELKGTNTKDLESIRKQAFDYKANQKDCVYVVTSNFEKLRFYINDATEFEEFNLFMVSEDEFALLYLCLHKDNILSNLPLKIKEESIIQEEQITKKFYADYSLFKRELFRDLVKQNVKRIKAGQHQQTIDETPEEERKQLEKNVKLALFKKSQKLIDRFLFVFFAEDRSLLPANSTAQILNKWKADIDFGDNRPLYDLFKQYFNYLDSGRKGTTSRAEIYAYNGGLFKPDSILDNLVIDDQLLYKHTLKLATYDFESQVDVNILGHIFENSLNEIESVNAEIEGAEFDKQKSKRKKDGVFYTPKYITKFIVENTVGKLCEEKKVELGFQEEEYFKSRANRPKKKLQELVELLDNYRDWLLQLTICDPACGSGAFLNQALDFLIKEHRYIDELKANVLGGGLVFSDIENTILENNIYGVDLNEESVEIAKLSLWLRTAQPRRKLNDLNSNIKCGNSLIDDKKVAGDKAFNWQQQFPQIFEKGGFDVVIGNPPYGINIKNEKDYFKANYKSTEGPFELYKFFIEKSLKLIKTNKLLGFITPDTWTNLSYFKKLRKIILVQNKLKLCSVSLYGIFEDAVVDTSIFIIEKSSEINDLLEFTAVDVSLEKTFNATIRRTDDDYLLNFKERNQIIEKIDKLKNSMDDYCEIWRGMSAYGAKSIDRPFNSNTKDSEFHRKMLNGGDIGRYVIKWSGEYIKYGDWLHRPRPEYIYSSPKIMIQRIRNPKLKDRIIAVSDIDAYISSDGLTNVLLKENIDIQINDVLAILNSKLINYWFSYYYFDVNIKPEQIRQIPIPKNKDFKSIAISELVSLMLNFTIDLNETSNKFQRILQRKFEGLDKLSKKLESWYELSYAEFIKELGKKKIKLSLSEEAEWEDYFIAEQQKAVALKAQIDKTDREIDGMVYELYGLTEEEILIVENS